ncbi:MAG: hypothetical protein K2K02_10470 [Ruminococcus sp.]|nr:hypothetical protein [Ruminococcus sp.]MDE6679449.1 hypothetical protein [Ruminococcus sp.]
MKTEKIKKSRKRVAIKIIIAVLLIWVLLVITDFIRFKTSDGYIEPLITITHMACDCGESRSECGIGYSFDYDYILDIGNSSWKYDKEKPDSRRFSVLGKDLYKKG